MPPPKIWTREVVLATLIHAVENNGSLRIADFPGRFGYAAREAFGTWAKAVGKAAEIAGMDVTERTKKSGGRASARV